MSILFSPSARVGEKGRPRFWVLRAWQHFQLPTPFVSTPWPECFPFMRRSKAQQVCFLPDEKKSSWGVSWNKEDEPNPPRLASELGWYDTTDRSVLISLRSPSLSSLCCVLPSKYATKLNVNHNPHGATACHPDPESYRGLWGGKTVSFTQSDGYAHSHPSFAFCLTL